MPASFGDYFPDGDYVGWDEALKKHYANNMSAEEKTALGMEERILYSQFSSKFIKDYGQVKLVECPAEFRTEKKYKTLGSLIQLTSRLLAVNDALKTVIEKFEPDVHQFFPLRISMPRGEAYPKPYYVLVIRQFLNSFSVEDSAEGSLREGTGPSKGYYTPFIASKKYFNGIAVSHDVIGDTHLWREQKLRGFDLFLSDGMQVEIKRLGLRVPKHYKLKAA